MGGFFFGGEGRREGGKNRVFSLRGTKRSSLKLESNYTQDLKAAKRPKEQPYVIHHRHGVKRAREHDYNNTYIVQFIPL